MENGEWRFPLDERKKADALAVIRQEAAKKRIRHYPSFLENVWSQMRFQSWTHWILEGGILLSAMLFAVSLRGTSADGAEKIAMCSVFFVFAGNICLSSIMRLFSWHMAELEQTLYLNLRQMVCIRMLEAGIFDLIVLLLLLGFIGEKSSIGAGEYLLYMLVPFLWSDTMYLFMLFFFRNRSSVLWSLLTGIICGTAALFPVIWKQAYAPEYKVIWLLLFIAGMILFVSEIYYILMKVEGGESICLSSN